jgi:hypothetical protein
MSANPLTLDGNGRLIAGQRAITLNTDNQMVVYMYRADLGQWVVLAPLGDPTGSPDPAPTFPFPQEFDDYFVTMLAYRLNPRYGRAMGADSGSRLADMQNKLQARYKQRKVVPTDLATLNLSVQAYNTWNGRGRVPWFGRLGWMN